uniref:Calcium-activated chloride channel regulator 1-like n=1 Tax=Phascolarctos cinereus TaxID=38626 RepID=A0A6P5JPP8_PHACI|nr:calcium-activated chloride channel regulator 1-like [Phascolarctos cinereus]
MQQASGIVPKDLNNFFHAGEVKMNPPRPEFNASDLQGKQVSFSRTASGGSFIVTNIPSGSIQDVFPPSQITDLKAQIEGNRINLTWTAPGDDYDDGQAQEYIIRMSENILDLRDKFDDALQVNTTHLTPKEASTQEFFVFEPKGINLVNGTNICIAIQAVDKANLKSKLSNIAQVSVFIPPEETPCSGSHIYKIMLKWLGELQVTIPK